MKKNQLQAKICYIKKNDTEFSDGYALFTSTDGGEAWGMNLFCKCYRREIDNKNAEPEYIHYTLLNEAARAQALGYKVRFDLEHPYESISDIER